MQSLLSQKLWTYIVQNNPELMLDLQESHSVTRYLEKKINSILPMVSELLSEGRPRYIIEELCLTELTRDLRPSKYNYIRNMLEEEFELYFLRMQETALLTYEIVNLISECNTVFERFGFSEDNEDDRMLRSAIIGTIRRYMESK